MKKINILFVEFCPISGSPAGLITQLEYMKKYYDYNFNCVVVGMPGSILDETCKRLDIQYYPIDSVQLTNFSNEPLKTTVVYLLGIINLFKISVRHRIQLIHCYHYLWSIYVNPISFLLQIPVIIHLKDVFKLEPKISRILMKFNSKAIFIAVSKYVERLFTQYYKIKKDKTVMIYDGINPDIFSKISDNKIEKKYLSTHKKFVMMSRIVEERNIEIFIDLAGLLVKKHPNYRFYHYGFHKKFNYTNDYFLQLKKRVKELGLNNYFHFRNYANKSSQVAKILQSAFLSIVPAERFALPNTAIESMMCGTPTIAYNTGGNSEIISNQEMGLLIDSNSALLYEYAVETYVNNKSKYMSASLVGSSYVQKFSVSTQFKKIINLYYDILHSH